MTANTHSQPEQLDEVVAAYLRAIENGETPNRSDLLARHPALVDDLREFFADHDRMNRLAQPLCEPTISHPAAVAAERIRYFGDYEVLDEIARGGMGVVFRARQVSLNRIVAIKMILSGQLASPENVERFHTEAEAAAKLDHPGIVPIYEVGQHQGQHYFSMGFVDGQSLSARVAQGPLPAREAARIVRVVGEAVQYAHEHGVIHRDLKPANILIDRQGKPRVTDFGLAKLTESVSDLTGTGQILGTPGYMPPEQAAARANSAGHLSDVYSLGAILYCLLTGRPPFQAATPLETLLQVQQQEPVSPRQLNPAIPLDLDTIVLKCLEKAPGRRYPSARELVDELQRFLDGHPIVARPVGTIERTWRWCRRNPVVGGLSAALLVVLLAGIGGITSEWLRAENHARRAKDKEDEAERALKVVQQEMSRADDALDELKRQNERTEEQRQIVETQKTLAEQRLQLAQLGTYDLQLVRVRDAWRDKPQYALELLNDLEKCPPELREFTWGHYHRLARPVAAVFPPVEGTSGSVAFAPDGQTFATVGKNAPIRIWHVTTSRELNVLAAPAGQRQGFGAVAFSPDGKRLASGGEDHVVRIWDPESGQQLAALAGHVNAISAVAFSRDGQLLVSADHDQKIVFWDQATRQPRAILEAGEAGAEKGPVRIAFSPDRKTLASGGVDKTIRLWDVTTCQQRSVLTGHKRAVQSLAFSPDGKLLASIGAYEYARLWDLATSLESASLSAPLMSSSSPNPCVAFSPDGKTLTVASYSIDLWDVSARQMQKKIIRPPGPLFSLAFSPNGRVLAGCSAGPELLNPITLWDVSSAELRDRLPDTLISSGSAVRCIALSSKSQTLAAADADGTITIWDLDATRPRLVITGHPGNIRCLTFSPDGRTLAWVSRNKSIVLWDAIEKQTSAIIDAPADAIFCLGFSPDAKRVAAAGWNGNVRIWDATTGAAQATCRGHIGSINSLVFSPDGRTLATGGDDQSVRLWDAVRGQERVVLRGHTGPVNSVAFSADSCALASAGNDKTIRLWDVKNEREQATLREYAGPVWSVGFSSDGKTLVSGSSPGTIKLRDAVTGVERATIDVAADPGTPIVPCFSCADQVLAAAIGNEIRLWWSRRGPEPAHPDADSEGESPITRIVFDQARPSEPSPPVISNPGDSPQWGYSPSRNNVRDGAAMPLEWDAKTGKNIKWIARLGSQTYSNPVISGGNVFIGTNNAAGHVPRLPNKIDLSCLLCFDEATGRFRWQYSSPKLAIGRAQDWDQLGLCATPLVEGQRLWMVTNRCEVVCLDTEGFFDGENDGPFRGEEVENLDEADVIWKFDMIGQWGVSPHNQSTCSLTAAGDILFVNTSNGIDEAHKTIPRPHSPSFAALDRNTGKVLWTDNSPGANIMHGQWSSPSYAILGERPQALFAGGDGWLYSFDPAGDGTGNAKLLWKFDCNPKESLYRLERATRNPFLGFPVIANGLVYIAVGEDPEHGEGPGHLWCIDPTRRLDGSDVSPELVFNQRDPAQVIPHRRLQACVPAEGDFTRDNPDSAAVWHYTGSNPKIFEQTMHRAIGSPAIKDDLLYICDTSGLFHCVDAKTGVACWTHDTLAMCWSSPAVIDDRVYLPDQDGKITIFRHARERQMLNEVQMDESIQMATPVVANDTLYIATMNKLYAIADGASGAAGDSPPNAGKVGGADTNGNPAAPTNRRPSQPGAELTLPTRSLSGHQGPVWGVAWSPDGSLIASGSDDKTIRLWNAESGDLRTELNGHTSQVRALAFSPDGRTLASGSHDKSIRLWDPASSGLLGIIQDTDPVYFPAFSGDGRLLVTSSSDRHPRVWNVSDRTLVRKLEGHTRTAWASAVSRTTNQIATGGHDVAINIWEASDGRLVRTMNAHPPGLGFLNYSPNGRLLASVGMGSDTSIRIWDPDRGTLMLVISVPAPGVYEVAFTLDGKSLAAACGDGVVRLYDVESGALFKSFRGGGLCVAFSPDGRFLASGGQDARVCVWDVSSAQKAP